MLALKIIAVLGILLGAVSFVIEGRRANKQSKAIFTTLIILSALMLFVTFKAEAAFTSYAEAQKTTQEAQNTENTENSEEFDFSDSTEPETVQNETVEDEFDLRDDTDKATDAAVERAEEVAAEIIASQKDEDEQAQDENEQAQGEEAAPEVPVEDPLAPIADAGPDVTNGKVNKKIFFSAKNSKRKHKGAKITTYVWDFGDGYTGEGKEIKHSYAQPGTYIATLTVLDAEDRFAVAVRTIEIEE